MFSPIQFHSILNEVKKNPPKHIKLQFLEWPPEADLKRAHLQNESAQLSSRNKDD